MLMSFDDQTGFLCGFHNDINAMEFDWGHQTHSCGFCYFAKSQPHGDVDCVMNKIVANRLVTRRRSGLEGFCHLGLFDLAEPLIFRGRVLGVFYYGSVRIRGKEKISELRVRSYCERRGFDPSSYLKELAKVPAIEESSIPRHREALRSVARLAHYFCEVHGVCPDLYHQREQRYPYLDPQQLPYVVKETIKFISSHISETFIVKDIASHLRCHPDFLSRRFKQQTGIDLSVYLQQARIERAKRLLENPKIDIGTASDLSGFSDRVHFSKVFRRVTGTTPGQYQKQLATARAIEPADASPKPAKLKLVARPRGKAVASRRG